MSNTKSQNIAIIGSGISGLTAGYLLNKQHNIKVFEANSYIGGHTATIDVNIDNTDYAIDTGFIVFNEWTYPNFIRLMRDIGIQGIPTPMSFSLCCEKTGVEYAGSSLDALFCQRKNLFSPSFLSMVRGILRFNKEAIEDLDNNRTPTNTTLGEYLLHKKYSQRFIQHYLIPMGAAIWSASTQEMMDFPLIFFLRFFKNHGLVQLKDRPQWFVIPNGSRSYIDPLTKSFSDKIHLNTPVQSVTREAKGVIVQSENGKEHFDHVIFACHSDQALSLLQNPSAAEEKILSAIPYKDNEVVLHTDDSLLPKNKKAWSAWNYHLTREDQSSAVLTYNMNILQHIEADKTFCVTLNHKGAIDKNKILRTFNYAHPTFTLESIEAQQRLPEVNGKNNISYCGAWTRNGFHEDGVVSAINVAKGFGLTFPS